MTEFAHQLLITLDIGGTRASGFGVPWPDGPAVPLEAPSKNLRAIDDIELGKLLSAIRDQMAEHGISQPAYWLIGAAGGRPDRDSARIARILADLNLPTSGIEVYRDFEANHSAAFGGEDGILSVNGTGSVLYGRWKGREGRRAGWGYLLDELPSAGAFGRWALQAILQLQAGTPVSPIWEQLVSANLPPELATSASLLDHIYASASPQKLLAGFGPLFSQAWSENCPWSRARVEASFDLWAVEMRHLADALLLSLPSPLLLPHLAPISGTPLPASVLLPVPVPVPALPPLSALAPIPFSGLGALWKYWPGCITLSQAALTKTFPGKFAWRSPCFAPAWGPLLLHLKNVTSDAAAARTAVSRLADAKTPKFFQASIPSETSAAGPRPHAANR